MNITFAGSNENQSGQRFLDSSDPRLIRHVVSCETAGGDDAPLMWDNNPLPAGKDQKLSHGFGDRALDVSALCAGGLSSLEVSETKLTNQSEMEAAALIRFAKSIGKPIYCLRWPRHAGHETKVHRAW